MQKPRAKASLPRSYDTSVLANAPQQRRSQELSLRILEASERVLRDGGLPAFTIQAVATEAGVSVGGIYGRFKNREELLTAIHTEVLLKIQHHLEAVASRAFSDLQEAAAVFATEVVDVFRENGDLLPIVQSKGDYPTVLRVERSIRAALAKAIAPFRAQITHPDPDLAVRLTVHLLLASTVRERTTDPSATDRTIGWNNLRRELPRVARAVFTGVY